MVAISRHAGGHAVDAATVLTGPLRSVCRPSRSTASSGLTATRLSRGSSALVEGSAGFSTTARRPDAYRFRAAQMTRCRRSAAARSVPVAIPSWSSAVSAGRSEAVTHLCRAFRDVFPDNRTAH